MKAHCGGNSDGNSQVTGNSEFLSALTAFTLQILILRYMNLRAPRVIGEYSQGEIGRHFDDLIMATVTIMIITR